MALLELRAFFILSLASSANLRLMEQSMCSNHCKTTRKHCECDPPCALFGDCCLDSKYLAVPVWRNGIHCSAVENHIQRVYQINTCNDNLQSLWDYATFEEIRSKCYKNDQYTSLPVTSVRTHITYKNYYCSLCNRDSNVVTWILTFRPPSASNITEEFINDNVLFNTETQKWGLYLWAEDHYYFLNLLPQLEFPEGIQPRVCSEDFISWCPSDWRDSLVQQMCDIYQDPVMYGSRIFKNKDCALCHRIPKDFLTCLKFPSIDRGSEGFGGGIPPEISLRAPFSGKSLFRNSPSSPCTGDKKLVNGECKDTDDIS